MSRRRAKASPRGKEEDVRTMAGLVTAGIISLVAVSYTHLTLPTILLV